MQNINDAYGLRSSAVIVLPDAVHTRYSYRIPLFLLNLVCVYYTNAMLLDVDEFIYYMGRQESVFLFLQS